VRATAKPFGQGQQPVRIDLATITLRQLFQQDRVYGRLPKGARSYRIQQPRHAEKKVSLDMADTVELNAVSSWKFGLFIVIHAATLNRPAYQEECLAEVLAG
jgi:hypothetical protein